LPSRGISEKLTEVDFIDKLDPNVSTVISVCLPVRPRFWANSEFIKEMSLAESNRAKVFKQHPLGPCTVTGNTWKCTAEHFLLSVNLCKFDFS
jgi:hypothetical protein